MNQFGSTVDSGLIKLNYDSGLSPLQEALKKKRQRLAETKLGLIKEPNSDQDDQDE